MPQPGTMTALATIVLLVVQMHAQRSQGGPGGSGGFVAHRSVRMASAQAEGSGLPELGRIREEAMRMRRRRSRRRRCARPENGGAGRRHLSARTSADGRIWPRLMHTRKRERVLPESEDIGGHWRSPFNRWKL